MPVHVDLPLACNGRLLAPPGNACAHLAVSAAAVLPQAHGAAGLSRRRTQPLASMASEPV